MADGADMTSGTGVVASLRWSRWLGRDRVRAYALIGLAVELLALLFWAGRTYDLYLPINPPTSLDFMSFYAAGTLVDKGTPADVYNPAIHEKTEKAIYGDPRIPYFGFYYPPVYELVCAVLPLLPFTLSYLAFVLVTGLAFVFVLRSTVRDDILVMALLTFPAAFYSVALGQDSFLTAALFGGALLVLDRRPALAGFLLACLCYKPHFLLLAPVALIAGRYWTALIAAAVTGIALGLLSLLFLGWHSWEAFLGNVGLAQSVFETGRVRFYHLVNLFGAVRLLGGGIALGLGVQALAALFAATVTAIVWYRGAAPAIRAATLIAATMVAMPVILFYDLLPATLAMGWLMRDARGQRQGYLPWEKMALLAMWPIALLCRGIGEKAGVPLGWLVTFGLLGLALGHFAREFDRSPRRLAAEKIGEKA
jgi:Glycosyltransferase family 87